MSLDRKAHIEGRVQMAIYYGFNVYVTSLETPQNIQSVPNNSSEFSYSLPNDQSILKLKMSLRDTKDNTAREDMLENLQAQVMVKTAETLNCQKIFVPDSATSLAIKLMSGEEISKLYDYLAIWT